MEKGKLPFRILIMLFQILKAIKKIIKIIPATTNEKLSCASYHSYMPTA